MAMHYIGPLLGQSARITFHEFVTECNYSINGQLNWRVIGINGNVTEGCEQVSYLQLSDTLHFLNWQEQSGSTVSQLIDIEAGNVKAFCTGPEEGRSNLFSASCFLRANLNLLDVLRAIAVVREERGMHTCCASISSFSSHCDV